MERTVDKKIVNQGSRRSPSSRMPSTPWVSLSSSLHKRIIWRSVSHYLDWGSIQAVFVDFGKQIQNDSFHLPPTPHAWWITLPTPPFPYSPPTPFPKSCIDLTVLSRFIQTSKLSNHICYAVSFRTWKCGFVGHFGALATSAEKTAVMGESFEKNMMCFVAEVFI